MGNDDSDPFTVYCLTCSFWCRVSLSASDSLHSSHFLPLHVLQVFRRGLSGQKQGHAFPRFQASHVQQVPNAISIASLIQRQDPLDSLITGLSGWVSSSPCFAHRSSANLDNYALFSFFFLLCAVPAKSWRRCGQMATWASQRSPSDLWPPPHSSRTPLWPWWINWPARSVVSAQCWPPAPFSLNLWGQLG